MWWNWQTRYFEVVVPKGVQVQVLSCAPFLLNYFSAQSFNLSSQSARIGRQLNSQVVWRNSHRHDAARLNDVQLESFCFDQHLI